MSTFGQQARIYISPANEEPIGGELVIFGDTESGDSRRKLQLLLFAKVTEKLNHQQIVTNKAKCQ